MEFALLIGLVAGLVSFLPYLGLIVGVAIAGTAILFQTQDMLDLFWVFAILGMVQMSERMLLTPVLVGENGLYPVTETLGAIDLDDSSHEVRE